MVMPAVPGAYLIFIHAHLAFAAFETCFNAGARFDDARQFPKRWLLQHHPASLRRREGILVAMSGVLLGGIARGTGLPCPLVRQRPTGDHQPLFGADPLALDTRLHPTPHHRDLSWPFLPVSHRQMPPRIGGKALPPLRHGLPRSLGATTMPLILGWRGLEVTHRGGARDPQHRALTPLASLLAKPRVATELLIASDPAVRDPISPHVEHLHTLLLACVRANRWWHVACLAPLLVACPFLG